jgi:hypothetical protein
MYYSHHPLLHSRSVHWPEGKITQRFPSTPMRLNAPLYWHETHHHPNVLLHKTRHIWFITDVDFNGCHRSTRTGQRSNRSEKKKNIQNLTEALTRSKPLCMAVSPPGWTMRSCSSPWPILSLQLTHTRPQAAGLPLVSSRATEGVLF